MCTRHRIDVQETDFVLADLLQLARIDFGPLHERVRIGLTHEPGTMMDADHFVHRGTSSYHRTAGRGPGKEAP